MNKHESVIRTAALLARLRHAQEDSDILIKAAEAFSKLEEERDALALECERWSAVATDIVDKHSVSQCFLDYMDETRGTDWGKCLASREARAKAEALKEAALLYPEDPTTDCDYVREDLMGMAEKYRNLSE